MTTTASTTGQPEGQRFRKRPIVIEAMRWTGDNFGAVVDFLGEDFAGADRGPAFDEVAIATLEGPITASLGDWIIRGVAGEFYPIKDDIFRATYEAVSDES